MKRNLDVFASRIAVCRRRILRMVVMKSCGVLIQFEDEDREHETVRLECNDVSMWREGNICFDIPKTYISKKIYVMTSGKRMFWAVFSKNCVLKIGYDEFDWNLCFDKPVIVSSHLSFSSHYFRHSFKSVLLETLLYSNNAFENHNNKINIKSIIFNNTSY